jgi:hypothetical protein
MVGIKHIVDATSFARTVVAVSEPAQARNRARVKIVIDEATGPVMLSGQVAGD